MRSSTVLLATAALTTALALPRQTTTTTETISITSFYISSIAVSGSANYSFHASVANGGQQDTCTYNPQIAGNDGRCPNAPPIAGTRTPLQCSADEFSWSLTSQLSPTYPSTQGFSLQVNHTLTDGSVLTGCRFIGGEYFKRQGQSGGPPMDDGEYYDGPHAFNITASHASHACVYA